MTTKTDLQTEAEELGIEGYESMTVAQLEAAIAEYETEPDEPAPTLDGPAPGGLSWVDYFNGQRVEPADDEEEEVVEPAEEVPV